MKLTLGFSRPRGGFKPFAWAIMAVQWNNYDHCYVKFESPSLNRTLVYQASSTMVNFMGLEVFNAANISVAEYELEVTDDHRTALLQYFVDKAGTPYGTLQVLGIVIYLLTKKKFFGNGDNDYVCSELVVRILAGLSVDEKSLGDPDFVMPKDLRNMMDANPLFKRTL